MKNVGIYYYPWYNAERWKQHEICFTPSIGFYNSNIESVIEYHIECLKIIEFDYVVIEFIRTNDWNFGHCIDAVIKLVSKLRNNGIKYTFLIDFISPCDEFVTIDEIRKLLTIIKNSDIFPTYKLNTKYLFFLFGISIENSYKIHNYFSEYQFFIAHYVPDWWMTFQAFNILRKKFNKHAIKTCNILYSDHILQSDKIFFAFEYNKYIPFWCSTEHLVSMNNFCPVIPGYNDLLLHRNPQLAPVVPRKDGQTLVEQFAIANALNAENILIYGFNEFFEGTNIEPTLEYGDFYVKLTKELVRQTHAGEQIHFPEDLKPGKGKIIYLSPEIERAAQRHADKIPRWDADWWLATVECLDAPVVSENEVLFERVRVTNTGTKTWPLASENAPIRLGARLCDSEGTVLSEGRALLRDADIQPDMTLECSLRVEIPHGKTPSSVHVGVVWENKFWLDHSEEIIL